MRGNAWISVLALMVAVGGALVRGEDTVRDDTCFQVYAPYSPEIDIGSDVAIVYGVNSTFASRVAQWREKGYAVSMMTGIAWGDYADYYGSGEAFKKDEVQTRKDGSLFMHGKDVGYNVPTPDYIDYIKRVVAPAVEQGVKAIYLEEPEFWAESGWSKAFQKEWQKFYGEPWQAPDSSVDAQYRASKLKYEMYFNALREVFSHIKKLAGEKGIQVECHVPTHSLLNYAHWRIVSPESRLMDLPEMDGYIAQVWTGTSRTPNVYAGVRKERTFETAFLEYGQMLAMVRPTGRKVWFLADPIEDNPNHSWADYKMNYECTVIAQLMCPEACRFEVMPWPDRIFKGTYPKTDLNHAASEREGIPSDYATQILTVINALNEMNQGEVRFDSGSRGVGVIVSDTLMFQRCGPDATDGDFGEFYGLALPLLKAGVPVQPVQLENILQPRCLEPYDVLILTYENQKPLKAAYHEVLANWVRSGGALIYVGDGSDPYHRVREWWNGEGKTEAKAFDDLFSRLGVTKTAYSKPQRVDRGHIRVLGEHPLALTRDTKGAARLRFAVAEMLRTHGRELETKNYLSIRRGPFVAASVLDESISDRPLELRGEYVDLFDPALPVIREKILGPNQRTLLFDLNWAREKKCAAKVIAAGARIREERLEGSRFDFIARGPAATICQARILLPGKPIRVQAGEVSLKSRWDPDSSTLWMAFPNQARDLHITIEWSARS